MNGLWIISELLRPRTARPLGLDRIRAVRGLPFAGLSTPWIWGIALGVVGVLIVVTVVVLAGRRYGQIEQSWSTFRKLSNQAGLSNEERTLLAGAARASGLGDRPDRIFTAQQAFQEGLAGLGRARRTWATPAGAPSVCATCSYLVSLREKLGFENSSDQPDPANVPLGHLEPGTALTVFRQDSPENLQVYVTDTRGEGRELVVLPEIPLTASVGATWLVRYPQAGMLWEFNAWVISNMAGEIVIRPAGRARWINRRRFIRAPVSRSARVALFPFRTQAAGTDGPRFVPGRLTEIGGPGMRIEAQLDAQVGQRVLVMIDLSDQAMEAVGTVRGVHASNGDPPQIAVELTGLDTSQIAELMRATNYEAQCGSQSDRPGARKSVAAGREVAHA